MPLDSGDTPPGDLALVDARGEELALEGFRGEATLLIFLRHLG